MATANGNDVLILLCQLFLGTTHRTIDNRQQRIDMANVATCSAPGCPEPGIHKCSSCKITPYCSVACQTIDWLHHKEECQGRLRKLGEAHLKKAEEFHEKHNWVQTIRFSELALNSLKKLNLRPLEVIEIIDDAMSYKFNSLNFMDQRREALECAKERYSLWAAGNMRHHRMLFAAFPLIESLIHNKEYEQAELIARTAYEMIIARYDNIIPEDQRQRFLADGSKLFAEATYRLAESGGIAPEVKQKVGENAIALARTALEIRSQLHGAESAQAANAMTSLANISGYFNDIGDDEILRLQEQAIAVYLRVEGNSSPNVAVSGHNLAAAYEIRAARAWDTNDLDRCIANLELALTHYREAERTFRTINHVDNADRSIRRIEIVEARLIEARVARI